MIELPESYHLAKQLNEVLAGRKIVQEEIDAHPHKFCFYFGDKERYYKLLHQKRFEKAEPIGGNIECTVEDVRLVFGEGLNLRIIDSEKQLPKKHQICLKLDNDTWLTGSSQMYGAIQAFYPGEMDDNKYYVWSREKPSPLSDTFDYEYFCSLYEEAKKSISMKAFLATEQRIPGLGNGVLQDILFRAQMHPKRKLETLTKEELYYLYETVKGTIKEMAEKGGRDTEKDIYGQPGGYQTILSKNTLQEPCPVCGGFISKQAYMGGAVYYCPQCQPSGT